MPFTNPIVAGNTLIRTAIQSANFNNPVDGVVSGWQIAADGSATFNNVTVGGASYTIGSDGEASFDIVNANTDIVLGGVSLSDTLAALPGGLLSYGDSASANNTGTQWSVDSAAISTTATPVVEMAFGPIDPTHIYRLTIAYNTLFTVAGDRFSSALRYTIDGTTPGTGSFLLDGSNENIVAPSATNVRQTNIFYYYDSTVIPIVRACLVLVRASGTGTIALDLNDSNTKFTYAFEDLGIRANAVSGGSLAQLSKSSGTPDPPPTKTYVTTYQCTWSRAWNNAGAAVYATNDVIKQGYIAGSGAGGSLGNAVSWIGFDFATIQSNLSGATISKVEVYLYYNHWYNGSGGTAVIGTHNSTATSAPSYNSSLDHQNRKQVSGWQANSAKWVDITSVVGTEFKTGVSTGIVLGIGPSTSATYYGKANGNTQSAEPALRITYVK